MSRLSILMLSLSAMMGKLIFRLVKYLIKQLSLAMVCEFGENLVDFSFEFYCSFVYSRIFTSSVESALIPPNKSSFECGLRFQKWHSMLFPLIFLLLQNLPSHKKKNLQKSQKLTSLSYETKDNHVTTLFYHSKVGSSTVFNKIICSSKSCLNSHFSFLSRQKCHTIHDFTSIVRSKSSFSATRIDSRRGHDKIQFKISITKHVMRQWIEE